MKRVAKLVQISVFVFAAFGFIVAVLLVAAFGYGRWQRRSYVYPSAVNESVFIESYKLQPVLTPFLANSTWSMVGPNIDSSPGIGSARYEYNTSISFVVPKDQWPSLPAAVVDDAIAHIEHNGGRVLTRSRTPTGGTRCEYLIGHSAGVMILTSAQSSTVVRNMPLPSNLEDVSIQVKINERGFPKGTPKL